MASLGFGVLLAVAVLLPDSVRAQSFTWGGTGSTTATSAYSTGTNWSNPPAGAPPIVPGQSAVFGATGSSTITIGGGPMLPDSWTFSANSQSYTISGNPVDFSLSGPTGGLINNANAGQTITISANINDAGGGPVMVQQLGNSTLVLAGTNGYSGGTLISAGTVQVNNADSVGSGTVTLNGGTFQLQSGSVAFSNNFAVNAAGGTVDANGGQLNLGGVIADGAGAGVLRVTDSAGGGSVQLSGVNTYSGGTLVSGTTLIVSNNSSVGTGKVTLDNSSFQADGLSSLTFTNNFTLSGTAPGSAIDSNGTTLTIARQHFRHGQADHPRCQFRQRRRGADRHQHLHRRHRHLQLRHAGTGRSDPCRLDHRRRDQRRPVLHQQRQYLGLDLDHDRWRQHGIPE